MKLYKAGSGREHFLEYYKAGGAYFLEFYKAGEGRRESALHGIVQGGRRRAYS